MSTKLHVLASQAILPDRYEPQEATIEIDVEAGTILSVKAGLHRPEGDFGEVLELDPAQILLPGLIE